MPKNPWKVVILISPKKTTIPVAKIWTKNFLNGDIATISSLRPMKNSSTPPANIRWMLGVERPNKVTEEIKPAKMASPPRRGVSDWCIPLKFGSSSRFFRCATLMMLGIAKTAITNDQRKARNKLSHVSTYLE
jgi:hypothetical protein